jgi:uncharacterized protein YjbJ (UPF0337 family)
MFTSVLKGYSRYRNINVFEAKFYSEGENDMDATKDILFGKWHELKGQVRQQWGKLTDDDMTQLSGKSEELAGVLQQRYGYGKAQAETEINNWLRDNT